MLANSMKLKENMKWYFFIFDKNSPPRNKLFFLKMLENSIKHEVNIKWDFFLSTIWGKYLLFNSMLKVPIYYLEEPPPI